MCVYVCLVNLISAPQRHAAMGFYSIQGMKKQGDNVKNCYRDTDGVQ